MNTHYHFVKKLSFQEATNMSPEVLLQEIYRNKVVVLHNSVNIENYVTLMKKLGTVINYSGAQYEPFHPSGYPEILQIFNLYLDGKSTGIHEEGNEYFLTQWHTHFSYKTENKVLSSLQAHQLNKVQNDQGTEFIDCVAGLAILQEAIESGELDLGHDNIKLSTLIVKHAYGNRSKYQNKMVKHPLIITHPITKLQSIYAVSATSVGLDGFDQSKSQMILSKIQTFLINHAPRYVHKYEIGDIVIWDNLTTLHRGPVLKVKTLTNDCRILYLMNVDWTIWGL